MNDITREILTDIYEIEIFEFVMNCENCDGIMIIFKKNSSHEYH